MLMLSCSDDTSKQDREAAQRAVNVVDEELEDQNFVVAYEREEQEEGFRSESAECREFTALFESENDSELPGQTAKAESYDWEWQGGESPETSGSQRVAALVTFVQDEKILDREFALLNEEKLPRCLGELVRAESAEAQPKGLELTVSEPVVERRDIALGDRGEALIVKMSLTQTASPDSGLQLPDGSSTRSLSAALEIYMLRSGRAEVVLFVTTFGAEPAAPVDRNDLLTRMTAEVER